MAATVIIELESGSSRGRRHPHNGYYAGDFGPTRSSAPVGWQIPVPTYDDGPGTAISA